MRLFRFMALLAFLPLVGVSQPIETPSPDRISIAVVPKGTNEEVWRAIHAGAIKARNELKEEGIELEILWKDSSSILRREQEIQVVDTYTGQRLSGILVASLDREKLEEPVRVDAVSKLPTVFINAALDADQAISYVATDNFNAGVAGADRIAQLIDEVGNVIVFRDKIGDINAEAHEAGFIERIKLKYPSIRLISMDRHAGTTYEGAYDASEYLLNRYGRRVNAVYASSELGTRSMLTALRDFQLAGQVYLVGSGADEQVVSAIRSGEVHGVIVSNPFRMGYLGVTTLVDHIQGRTIPTVVDSEITMITLGNLDTDEIVELLNPPISDYLD
mgnify:CR=1 FL=1